MVSGSLFPMASSAFWQRNCGKHHFKLGRHRLVEFWQGQFSCQVLRLSVTPPGVCIPRPIRALKVIGRTPSWKAGSGVVPAVAAALASGFCSIILVSIRHGCEYCPDSSPSVTLRIWHSIQDARRGCILSSAGLREEQHSAVERAGG